MNMFNEAVENAFRELKAFRIMVYIIFGLGVIGGAIVIKQQFFFERKEFVPYSAKVVSSYTETFMRAGTYYQYINLNNNCCFISNGFSSIVNGKKTRLIDYIAIGDSVVRNTWDTIYIYREGSEMYKFTHNKNDNRE